MFQFAFFFISLFLGALAPQDRLDQALSLLKEGRFEEAKILCEEERKEGSDYLRACRMLDDIGLWQETLKDRSLKAIYGYLANSREKVFEAEALALLPDLIEKEAWQDALKADKTSGYRLFLKEHPGTRYETEARNHVAQAMAGHFKKNTKIRDKDRALEYAMDEPTREYVEYAYAAATHTLDTSIVWHTNPQVPYWSNKARKKVTVSVGVVATGAWGKHKWGAPDSDTKLYVTDYLSGAGFAVRFGDVSKVTNSVFAGYVLKNRCMLPTEHQDVISGAFSIDENWNFYRKERMAVFMNAGILIELPWIAQFRGGFGMSWKHGEWKSGVVLFRSWSETPTMFVPLMGTSLTYFF